MNHRLGRRCLNRSSLTDLAKGRETKGQASCKKLNVVEVKTLLEKSFPVPGDGHTLTRSSNSEVETILGCPLKRRASRKGVHR